MTNFIKYFFILSLVFSVNSSFAQERQQVETEVTVTYANFLGKTLPIRDLVPIPMMSEEKRKQLRRTKKAPNNFAGRGKYISSNPNALPQGEDKLRQSSFERSNGGFLVEPIINRNGITSGTSPNDPTGDIGKDHYMQAVNATQLVVYDKEGNQVGNVFNANTIWNSLGFSSAGDPIVMYDQEFDRWIITEFPSGNQLLFAISEDSDPFGSYSAYNFGTPNFPDYPKYGIWPNAYTVTTNEGGPGESSCYFINREAMLNGDATVMVQRLTIPGENGGPGFQVDTPVDWSGLTPPPANASPLVVSMIDDAWGAGLQDQIDIYSFNIDWDNPNNSAIEVENIAVSPFDSNPCSAAGPGFACIPQLNGSGLDGLPETIMFQPHYRNFGAYEVLLMCYITDVTGGQNLAGIRWVEMRRNPGTQWSVYQEGTFAPDDGLDRFMPTICMDGNGNIGLAYNTSSEETFADVRFTGRRSSDPLGEMTVNEYQAVAGGNAINSGGRFGDYAHMSIDPTNDRTFWFTTEYAGPNNVRTRVVAFELGRDTTDIGPISLLSPQNSDALTASENITIEVKNFGLDTQSVFKVGYIFENGMENIEDVTFDLYPDSIYTHTFASTVDMDNIQAYDFTLFTVLPTDDSILNDTLKTVVSKLTQYDAGITFISPFESLTCDDSIDFEYDLTNFGTLPLTSAIINIDMNGVLTTVNWEGNLAAGETETIAYTLTDFLNGTNQLNIEVANPNGFADQNIVNNTNSASFDALLDGASFELQINTDGFANETTWEIVDNEEQIIAMGGPYEGLNNELISEAFCLDAEDCYTFTMFDSYGDGICCAFGNGNYQIVDASGNAILSSTGEFGEQESNDFCGTFECMMTANIVLSTETSEGAADGTIMITPQNGVAPFNYSIDGGVNFQSNNIFDGLSAGTYNIVITGDSECLYEETVELSACTMMVSIEAMDDTDAPGGAGSIEVDVVGGTAPYLYSNNGGSTTQFSSIFFDLLAGEYDIWVEDANGCVFEMEIVLDEVVANEEVIYGQSFEVLPNPTTGVFRINAKGIDYPRSILMFQIYNELGQLVQRTNLTKYGNTFTGQVSLFDYPDGVYFIRFDDKDIQHLIRVVKQN